MRIENITFNAELLQQQLGLIGISAGGEKLSRWVTQGAIEATCTPDQEASVLAIIAAHDHTQKTIQQTQTEQAEAVQAAIQADVKTLMLGNVHMLNWADLIIPQAAYAVNRIVFKTDPVEAHTNTVALLNGALADQYDPQRRFWQNFCYTVWCGNFDYYTSDTWLDAYTEVATDIGVLPVSRGAIARTFRAMQPFVSVNAMQMLFPALAKLIAPELVTP